MWQQSASRLLQVNNDRLIFPSKFSKNLKLPSPLLHSYSTEFDLTFNGIKPGHKGFKLEYSKATCDRNFTELQGRIVHEGIDDCWITITAPENHTISLYFNQFMLYDQTDCTKAGLNASIASNSRSNANSCENFCFHWLITFT